jgi:hypothetical protein
MSENHIMEIYGLREQLANANEIREGLIRCRDTAVMYGHEVERKLAAMENLYREAREELKDEMPISEYATSEDYESYRRGFDMATEHMIKAARGEKGKTK